MDFDPFDMDPNDLPQPNLRFLRIDELTDDQLAMLALLGGDPATAERVYQSFYVGGRDETARLMGSKAAQIVHECACPVVEWRGRQRIIMPHGDVETRVSTPPQSQS